MDILLTALLFLFVYMCLAFVLSLVRRDNGTADIAYGWGFVLIAWTTFLLGNPGPAALLASLFATVWAARLSVRIYLRNVGKPEDFRYKEWRDAWGKTFVVRSFLQVYMLQGAIIFLVALPLSLLNIYGAGTGIELIAAIGFVLWGIGFFFETVGDYQLARFIGNPLNKGKVMDQGLWRYTRHPNYFGESLMWWGLAVAAYVTLEPLMGLSAFTVFVSPALITFLLLKASGVPLLEKRFEGKPEWEAYKKRTSVFLPLPPKH